MSDDVGRGRPVVVVTTISASLRLTTALNGRGPGLAVSVGDADRRAGELVALGDGGHLLAVEL